VLDFNACKSIVVAGACRKYLLKPVVSAVAELVAGKITGNAVQVSRVAEQQSTSGGRFTALWLCKPPARLRFWPLQHEHRAGTGRVVIVPPPPSRPGRQAMPAISFRTCQ